MTRYQKFRIVVSLFWLVLYWAGAAVIVGYYARPKSPAPGVWATIEAVGCFLFGVYMISNVGSVLKEADATESAAGVADRVKLEKKP